jgi:hypothetical protein
MRAREHGLILRLATKMQSFKTFLTEFKAMSRQTQSKKTKADKAKERDAKYLQDFDKRYNIQKHDASDRKWLKKHPEDGGLTQGSWDPNK